MATKTLLWCWMMMAVIKGINIMDISRIKDATYIRNGKVCYMCDQGYHVVEHCLETGTKSSCVICENGTYNPKNTRAISCIRCKECKPDENELSQCTHIMNRQCICREGLGKEIHDDTPDGYSCLNCSRIKKVLWEGEKEGKTHRYTCHSCGTENEGRCESANRHVLTPSFLNARSECQGCTNCAALGQASGIECTATADTQCTPDAKKIWFLVLVPVILIALAICGLVWWKQRRNNGSYSPTSP